MSHVIIITGPTATGKSESSLVVSKFCNGVVINCDSRQVYSELPIITDQPSENDNLISEHKLYGYVSATESYSIHRWLLDASNEIRNTILKNKFPILVGGTGMYISALINGLSYIPKISEDVREYSSKLLSKIGNEMFHFELSKIDEESSKIISKTDSYRMLRAFEVKKETGKSIIEWRKSKEKYMEYKASVFILMPERDLIKKSIEKRFDIMVSRGVIDEVRRFMMNKNFRKTQAFTSSGLCEISKYIDGEISLEEAILIAKIKTKQYAKRQGTWFRNKMRNEIFYSSKDDLIESAISKIRQNL